MHRAAGRARPVVRSIAALPYRRIAEQRRGAANRVLRAAPARRRGPARGHGLTRADRPAADDLRGAHERRRQSVDEPVLSAGVCRDSLYLEAELGRGQAAAARDRSAARAVRCPPALGQAVYHGAGAAALAVSEAAGFPTAADILRSTGQIPQSVPGYLSLGLRVPRNNAGSRASGRRRRGSPGARAACPGCPAPRSAR